MIGLEPIILYRTSAWRSSRIMAATAYGTSCFHLGHVDESVRVFAAASTECEGDQYEDAASSFGIDARSLFRGQWSRTLTCAGYLEQATRQAALSVASARQRQHLPSIAVTLSSSCYTTLAVRDLPLLQARSSELCQLAREQGFSFWLARGNSYAGWLAGAVGQLECGRALLSEALAEFDRMGVLLYRSESIGMLSDIHAWTGASELAFDLLDQALAMSAKTGEVWIDSDLHRRQGELRMADPARAEANFQRAIGIARTQSARLFELRASVSLARLWRDQGKRDEAHALLAPIHGWFTEGFDRPDLMDAKALLDELAAAPA